MESRTLGVQWHQERQLSLGRAFLPCPVSLSPAMKASCPHWSVTSSPPSNRISEVPDSLQETPPSGGRSAVCGGGVGRITRLSATLRTTNALFAGGRVAWVEEIVVREDRRREGIRGSKAAGHSVGVIGYGKAGWHYTYKLSSVLNNARGHLGSPDAISGMWCASNNQ